VSVLAGVDANFPVHLWCRLIPQAILTLNLLRPSNVASKVSAYAYVHGEFDYNEMPLAPMGCAVQVYETPHRRKTWAEHSVDEYYVGASPKHYRCHEVWVVKTKSERISETVFFKHKYITQPTLTSEDIIIKALQDPKHAIKGTHNVKGNANMEGLKKMKEIFDEIPVAKVKEKVKKVQFVENVPKVLNYSEDPRVPFM